jgi:hypothetical protein
MQSVFSHLVRTRLATESENVATEALGFILESSEAARGGMIKLLRGLVPELPELWFRTQQSEGCNRPDMWGNDSEAKPHVFIENKFWAGLTVNQPLSYLRLLAKQPHPTVLLVVAPAAREGTLSREFQRILAEAGVSTSEQNAIACIGWSVATGLGPILALISWTKLLAFLEGEVADDLPATRDLLQLRALCQAEDSEAFAPLCLEQTSDQRTPSLILNLFSIIQATVDKGTSDGTIDVKGLGNNWAVSSSRVGRYARLAGRSVGIWFGIHFRLWKRHGRSPLWVVFSRTPFGRSREVRRLLEPWALEADVLVAKDDDDFVVALDLPLGEEKGAVVSAVLQRLKEISIALSPLEPLPSEVKSDQ